MENFKNMLIEKVNIFVRTYNCLKCHGVSTVGDLSAMTKEDTKELFNKMTFFSSCKSRRCNKLLK